MNTAPGYRSVAQLRADLEGALAENVGPHRSDVDRGLSDLAVMLCQHRLNEALRPPRQHLNVYQLFNKLHAAGVSITINTETI